MKHTKIILVKLHKCGKLSDATVIGLSPAQWCGAIVAVKYIDENKLDHITCCGW